MGKRITWGNEPLEPCGVVAFTRCGHWWVYPTRATIEQMHDVAAFNLGLACSFCMADWQAASRVHARGTATRVN